MFTSLNLVYNNHLRAISKHICEIISDIISVRVKCELIKLSRRLGI